MAATNLVCYHHCNCEDRPAVSRCTKCGKGLCVECTDKLKSKDTGEILCVDCLNDEITADYAAADRARKAIKRELIFIIIGFIIGIPFFIVGLYGLLTTNENLILWIIFVCLPFLFASLRTIFCIAKDDHGLIVGLIIFIVLMLLSPIIFIWRVAVRIRDRRLLKSYKEWQAELYAANQEYYEVARSMSTRLENMDDFKRRIEVQYQVLLKQNEELYNNKIAEECAKHNAALEAEKAKRAQAEELQLKSAQTISELKEKVQSSNEKIINMSRGYQASGRRTVKA